MMENRDFPCQRNEFCGSQTQKICHVTKNWRPISLTLSQRKKKVMWRYAPYRKDDIYPFEPLETVLWCLRTRLQSHLNSVTSVQHISDMKNPDDQVLQSSAFGSSRKGYHCPIPGANVSNSTRKRRKCTTHFWHEKFWGWKTNDHGRS